MYKFIKSHNLSVFMAAKKAKTSDLSKVKKAIEELRPRLQMDGGDIKLVSFSNGVVKVELQGHCSGCPMAQMTLKGMVEEYLKEKVPSVKEVISD